jgi:hypothetical protein
MNCAIFRREASGYSTRGPIVPEMTLGEARKEIARLKAAYPYQDFVIMGEVGTVTRDETITVKIATPNVAPRTRKRPTPTFDRNVIRMRQEQG